MDTTLYIHIGTHKTGTTAIQSFFHINRDKLEENGLLYPGENENHHLVALELREANKSFFDTNSEVYKVFTEIGANCGIYKKILLSSEGFYLKDDILIPKLIEALTFFKINVPIKIIIFCRPQQECYESSYQQQIKKIGSFKTFRFNEFVKIKLESGAKDYYDHINLWCSFFGKENLIVVPYEAKQFGNKIFTDFKQILEIPDGLVLEEPSQSQSNIGLKTHTIEFLRWMNILKIEDEDFEEILLALAFEIKKEVGNYKLLTPQLAEEIYEKFEKSNSMLAREYLNRPDGIMFQNQKTVFPDDYQTYCQQDEFLPESFHREIGLIKKKNIEILESIDIHLHSYKSSDLVAMRAKQSFLNYLKKIISFDRKKMLQNMATGIRYRDMKLILLTKKWNTQLKINERNFLEKTFDYSKNIENNITIENGKIYLTSFGNDPYFSIAKTAGNYNTKTQLMFKFESPSDTDLQVFFQTQNNMEYAEENSVLRRIKKGLNTVCLMIDNKDFNGQLRIDPGMYSGCYVIHEICVKSDAKKDGNRLSKLKCWISGFLK